MRFPGVVASLIQAAGHSSVHVFDEVYMYVGFVHVCFNTPITNRADTMPAKAPNLGLRFVSLETACVGRRVRQDVSSRNCTRSGRAVLFCGE